MRKKKYIEVPGTWNGYELGDGKMSGSGYASYRLKVLLSETGRRFTFSLLDAATSLTMFVNGVKIYSCGIQGVSRNTSKPAYRPEYVTIPVETTELEIVLHIANYHHRLGGAWEPIRLAVWEHSRQRRVRMRFFDSFLSGCILIMGLYHIGLFIINRKQMNALFFSIFCMPGNFLR